MARLMFSSTMAGSKLVNSSGAGWPAGAIGGVGAGGRNPTDRSGGGAAKLEAMMAAACGFAVASALATAASWVAELFRRRAFSSRRDSTRRKTQQAERQDE